MQAVSIELKSVAKKFNNRWLFKNLNLAVNPSEKIAIIGPNGSGKSTLLKMIAGFLSSNKGETIYKNQNNNIEKENIFTNISVAAPYVALIDDYNLREFFQHISVFRKLKLQIDDIITLSELQASEKKPLKYFSSGMRQRVRLLQAILDTAPILLLDEPTSNLDAKAIQWYQELVNKYCAKKTIIVFSNAQPQDYSFCSKIIHLSDIITP